MIAFFATVSNRNKTTGRSISKEFGRKTLEQRWSNDPFFVVEAKILCQHQEVFKSNLAISIRITRRITDIIAAEMFGKD